MNARNKKAPPLPVLGIDTLRQLRELASQAYPGPYSIGELDGEQVLFDGFATIDCPSHGGFATYVHLMDGDDPEKPSESSLQARATGQLFTMVSPERVTALIKLAEKAIQLESDDYVLVPRTTLDKALKLCDGGGLYSVCVLLNEAIESANSAASELVWVRNVIAETMGTDAPLGEASSPLRDWLNELNVLRAEHDSVVEAWGWLWSVTTDDKRVQRARKIIGDHLSDTDKAEGIKTAKAYGAKVDTPEQTAAYDIPLFLRKNPGA